MVAPLPESLKILAFSLLTEGDGYLTECLQQFVQYGDVKQIQEDVLARLHPAASLARMGCCNGHIDTIPVDTAQRTNSVLLDLPVFLYMLVKCCSTLLVDMNNSSAISYIFQP